MHAVLAIDTATDACTVGLAQGNEVAELHRIIPRAHNQHILTMVDELLDGRPLDVIDAFACGLGPGSFTGLRIATSVIQGLAWSLEKPVMAMCSLELQARSALAHAELDQSYVLSVIDAQIGQVYWRWFHIAGGHLVPMSAAAMSLPADIVMPDPLGPCTVVGSGADLEAEFSPTLRVVSQQWLSDARPHGGVLASWAVETMQCTERPPLLRATDLSPHYVQETIGWKKLAEQPQRV